MAKNDFYAIKSRHHQITRPSLFPVYHKIDGLQPKERQITHITVCCSPPITKVHRNMMGDVASTCTFTDLVASLIYRVTMVGLLSSDCSFRSRPVLVFIFCKRPICVKGLTSAIFLSQNILGKKSVFSQMSVIKN